MSMEELLRRMTLEAENEIRLHRQGHWGDTDEVDNQYLIRLEQGEVAGHEQRTNLVYYLTVQPQRA
jgi:hypothetical protein